MLRGGMRLAAEALLLGTALFQAGCAGTRGTGVDFWTPPGARVRIDGESPGTIPLRRIVAPGVHAVEVAAPPASGERAGNALRGWIVVFAGAGKGGVRFDMDGADLLRAAGDGVLLWTGVGPSGREEAFLKATRDGVGREDPDVALAVGRDAERKAAVEAARRERMEQKEGGAFPELHLGDSWVVDCLGYVLILVIAFAFFFLAPNIAQ